MLEFALSGRRWGRPLVPDSRASGQVPSEPRPNERTNSQLHTSCVGVMDRGLVSSGPRMRGLFGWFLAVCPASLVVPGYFRERTLTDLTSQPPGFGNRRHCFLDCDAMLRQDFYSYPISIMALLKEQLMRNWAECAIGPDIWASMQRKTESEISTRFCPTCLRGRVFTRFFAFESVILMVVWEWYAGGPSAAVRVTSVLHFIANPITAIAQQRQAVGCPRSLINPNVYTETLLDGMRLQSCSQHIRSVKNGCRNGNILWLSSLLLSAVR